MSPWSIAALVFVCLFMLLALYAGWRRVNRQRAGGEGQTSSS